MKLKVTVYTNRDYLGKLEVISEGQIIKTFNVSAKTDPDLGIPNPPAGCYTFIESRPADSQALGTYGDQMLFFERDPGQSYVKPNLKNNFVLALYSGGWWGDGSSVTDGGLRVSNEAMTYLVSHYSSVSGENLELEIVEEKAGLWKRLFGNKVNKMRVPNIRPYNKSRFAGIFGDYYYDDDNIPYWLMMHYMWGEEAGYDNPDEEGYVGPSTPDFSSEPEPVEEEVTLGSYMQEPVHTIEPDVIPEPEPQGPPLIVDPYTTPISEPTPSDDMWNHSNLGDQPEPSHSGFTHVDLGGGTFSADNGWTSHELGSDTSTNDDANGVGY
jgi:hypothetical protein